MFVWLWLLGFSLASSPSEDATRALAEGRTEAALTILRRALSDDPDHELHCMLGRAALRAGRAAEADQVLERVPDEAACARAARSLRAEALWAQGRAPESAAAYEALGVSSLGPSRHQATANQLETWAEKLSQDRTDQAASLLTAALRLELPLERRRAIARKLAPLGSAASIKTLQEAIAEGGQSAPADRLLLAPLLPPAQGMAMLSPLPDSAEVLAARVLLSSALSLDQGLIVARSLIERHPQSEQAREARLELGAKLADAGWIAEASELLEPLAAKDDDHAERAAWILAQLLTRGPDQAEAERRLVDLLQRFPSATFRRSAEARLEQVRFHRAREARDAAGLRALADARPDSPERAFEAVLALEGQERLEALTELAARFAGQAIALQAIQARVELDEAGGLAWLEAQILAGRSDAHRVKKTLSEPALVIRSPGRQPRDPKVTLTVRNVSEVEIRLHAIDLEGYVRAGRSPTDLEALDVGIIAPDRSFTVDLGEAELGREREVEVPLPLRRPGLYAVTAALPDREARTFVLVSDIELVARTVGGELVATALRDGVPVPRARILAVGERAIEGRADGSGLARLEAPGQRLVVLAETSGGPAMLEIRSERNRPSAGLRVGLDLDRPIYLPGDQARFRIAGIRDGDPISGSWTVELRTAGRRDPLVHQTLRLSSDDYGTIQGSLTLPRSQRQNGPSTYELWALPPGEDSPRRLATLKTLPESPLPHTLTLEGDPEARYAKVRDADGLPLSNHPVQLSDNLGQDRVARTDARGLVSLLAPAEGLSWQLHAALPLSSVTTRRQRLFEQPALELDLDSEVLHSAHGGKVRLRGDAGVVRVKVRRRDAGPAAAEPIVLKTKLRPEPLRAFEPLGRPTPPQGVLRLVHDGKVVLSDEEHSFTLPTLEPGHYILTAVREDAAAAATHHALHVREGASLLLDGALQIGQPASIGMSEGAALVTAERGTLLDAAVIRAGQRWRPQPDPSWHGSVSIVATTPEGSVAHDRELDAALGVALDAEIHEGRWSVSGVVRDPSGRPQRAQVLVRASDIALIQDQGEASRLGLNLFTQPSGGRAYAAAARTLTGAAESIGVSSSLLAEAARVKEQARMRKARRGSLRDNELDAMMDDEFVPEPEPGFGGLGISGVGRGAGGAGSAVHGGTVGGKVGSGPVPSEHPPGARRSGLWEIVQTDRAGRFSIEAAAPSARATWRVEAIALGGGSVGHAKVEVEPPVGPALVVDPLAPGWPGDEARPRARVLVPEGGAEVRVIDGDTAHRCAEGPGEVCEYELRAMSPGDRRLVSVEVDGVVSARKELSFEVAAGTRDEEGPIYAALVGRPGGTLLGAIALEADPFLSDPRRAAIAGLCALEALPALSGDERDQALVLLRALVGDLRESPGRLDPSTAAAAIELMARSASVLGLPQRDVATFTGPLASIEPADARTRLALTWARAHIDGKAPEATLGRLVREADQLLEEDRALLARLLIKVGEPPTEQPFASDGPHAFLAARAVRGWRGPTIDDLLAAGPPALGDRDRPAWIRAVARELAKPAMPSQAAAGGVARSLQPLDGAITWREREPDTYTPTLSSSESLPARIPQRTDGLPHPDQRVGTSCGTAESPCQIQIGEGVSVPPGVLHPQGGLALVPRAGQVQAVAPGRYTVIGFHRDGRGSRLHVEVGANADTPLGSRPSVFLAQQAEATRDDPLVPLGDAPLQNWPKDLRATVARLRFTHTPTTDATALVAAFENLRDEAPNTPIPLERIAETAKAYQTIGRPDRARSLWQRVLGQDLLAEIGVSRQLERASGRLATIRALRETLRRAPAVREAEQATFALPDRLLALAENLPPQAIEAGVTATDVRLQAAAWDQEYLAFHLDSKEAPEAGLRLATTLYELGARERAVGWTERLQRRFPEHELLDDWLLLEGLARTELQDGRRARPLFTRIAEDDLPLGGGRSGPSPLRDDARYGLGRLAEAQDDLKAALDWYGKVSSAVPEASAARQALQAVSLDTEPVVRLSARGPTRLDLKVANVDQVHVSAFAVDLRTLFLRESGIPRPENLRVEGLSPTWTGTRRLRAGAFPERQELAVPLSGPGAWLVRIDGDGASASVLVVRSDLEVHPVDGTQRRLAVRERNTPVVEAGVRALGGSGIVAAQTDARGVALVPSGSPSLAWRGDHVAFTPDAIALTGPVRRGRASTAPAPDVLQMRQQQRERSRRSSNIQTYDYIGEEVEQSIRASDL